MATSVTLAALHLPFSTLVRRTMCGRGLLAILLQRCRQSLPVTAHKACVTCMLGRWPYVAGLGQLCIRMRFNMPGFAGTWEARAIMDNSCRCLERSPLTTPISLTLQRPSSIQALINEWHSGEVALTEIPVKLALQLKRYNQVGDKLRHSVQVGETLQLPVFLDDIQSQLLTYRVDAIVFHLGDRPNEGHYQTALQQAGQWFITNDGCKPTRAGAQTLAATVAQNSYLILCSKI